MLGFLCKDVPLTVADDFVVSRAVKDDGARRVAWPAGYTASSDGVQTANERLILPESF